MNTLKDASLKSTALKNNIVSINELIDSQGLTNWRITNDSVMGGKSQGEIIPAQDSIVFTGEISSENNGGFTSTFHPVTALVPNFHAISIDVQGDGHVYQLRLVTLVDGYRLSYKHEFSTSPHKRQKMAFKLTDFQASFRGRMITNAPELKSEDIIEVGFLLNFTKLKSYNSGPFSLSIF